MKEIETSKIIIRPYKPWAKDEVKNGREPYAILSYGNINMEIDYTLLNSLQFKLESESWIRSSCIISAGKDEILREMYTIMDGKLPKHHRDNKTKYTECLTHNPLHSFNKEITIGKKEILK